MGAPTRRLRPPARWILPFDPGPDDECGEMTGDAPGGVGLLAVWSILIPARGCALGDLTPSETTIVSLMITLPCTCPPLLPFQVRVVATESLVTMTMVPEVSASSALPSPRTTMVP